MDKIVETYQQDYKGEQFPKYRIELSKRFNPKVGAAPGDSGEESGGNFGGFGAKVMKKASTTGNPEESSGGEGGTDTSDDFQGMIGEIKKCKCKIALMPMTPTPERKIVSKFTEPFFDMVSLSIMMKKPILQ